MCCGFFGLFDRCRDAITIRYARKKGNFVALWILRIILFFGVGTCAGSVSYMPHEILAVYFICYTISLAFLFLLTFVAKRAVLLRFRDFPDSSDQSTPGYSNESSDSSESLLGPYKRYPIYTLPDNPVSLQNITEPRPQEQSHVNESIMDPSPALQEPKETLTVRAEVHNVQEFSPLNRRKVCTADSSSIGSSSDWDSHSTSKTPTEPAIGREEANLPDMTSSSGSLHSSDIVSRSSSEHKNKTRESRLNLQEKESTFIMGHSSNMESRSENRLTSTSSLATAEMGSILEYSSEAYNSPAYASFSGSSTESNAETENPENPQKRLK